MIRAGILTIALVATVAVGLSNAQRECAESIYGGPFAGSDASQYSVDMSIEPDSSIVSENGTISMETSYESGDPRDVIVLHADRSIQFDDIQVRTVYAGRETYVPVVFICRDSAKRLLVVRLGQNLESSQPIKVKFTAKVPLRDDGKGLHWLENGTIVGNFANSEARLIMPCIDDDYPKHRPSNFQINLMAEYRLESASPEFEIDYDGENGKIRLETSGRTSIGRIQFELKPLRASADNKRQL